MGKITEADVQSGGGGGSISGGTSLGTGDDVFKNVSGANLQFRSVKSSDSSVTIAQSANELDFKVDGTANTSAYFNAAGAIATLAGHAVEPTTYGLTTSLTVRPNALSGSFPLNQQSLDIDPLQNSPNETWSHTNYFYDIDPGATGFSVGSAGTAFTHAPVTINAQGTGNIGNLEFLKNNFTIGNGTDPITSKGVGYVYGQGTIQNGVTLNGPMQGYGFQWNIQAGAIVGASAYASGFYDNCSVACPWPASWNTFQSGPVLASIGNNFNYAGLNVNPEITSLTGNACAFGLTYSPKVTGYTGVGSQLCGVSLNPQTSSVHSAQLIFASLGNVTTYAGTTAGVIIQDLTFVTNNVGTGGNSITIAYTPGGTAGSETVSNVGLAFSVQIATGVSTATQVKAALDAYGQFTIHASVAISGSGANPQVTQGPASFTGGTDAGTRKAAYLDGDVEITGSLTFGGALSIGQLSAVASYTLVNGSGSPATLNGLISLISCGDNLTLTNVDVIGCNTASLITVGNNSTVTPSFLGVAALALPAVVKVGTASTLGLASGASFVVSLDAAAGAGSVITTLDLCRTLAIPNGITAITNLRGYTLDLPFGDPGTTTHGVHISPSTAHNYMALDLVIGNGGSDVPTNSSVALEIKSTTRTLRHANLTTAERNALTALAGMQIFNTTTSTLQYYDGATWI